MMVRRSTAAAGPGELVSRREAFVQVAERFLAGDYFLPYKYFIFYLTSILSNVIIIDR